MKIAMSLFLALLACGALRAETAAPRHSTAGNVGLNGIREHVSIKINKLRAGKDSISIVMDLGVERLGSNNSSEFAGHKITIALGSLVLEGVTDSKARINTAAFKMKLIARGAGLRIDVRNGVLTPLFSELTGKSGDIDMLLTLKEEPGTPAAAQHAEPRHDGHHKPPEEFMYKRLIGLEVEENEKTLQAKG